MTKGLEKKTEEIANQATGLKEVKLNANLLNSVLKKELTLCYIWLV